MAEPAHGPRRRTATKRYTLTTRALGAERVNWHPQVHQRFDEGLYFVLFRFSKPSDVAESLDRLMEEAGIHSYCAYTVFGYFDGLIRVWLTSHHWQRLLRCLSHHTVDIPEIRTLKVAQLRYLWAPSRGQSILAPSGPTEEFVAKVERNRRFIEEVARNPETPPRKPVETLLGEDLLLYKDRDQAALIKIFMVLQSAGSLSDVANPSEQITYELLRDDTFKDASLYSGDGDLASHLIRLTVGRYEDVLGLTKRMDEIVARLPLRTMTLLVANTAPIESDNINNIGALTSAEHRAATLLSLEIEDMETLEPESRGILERLTSRLAESLSDSDEWNTAQGVLRACVTGDRRAVRQHLSFVLDFEYYFRAYVGSILAEVYDTTSTGWELKVAAELTDVFRNVPEHDQVDMTRWSLGVVSAVLADLCDANPHIKARVFGDLGEDWRRTVRDVLNFRNPFAHGKLTRDVPHLNDLTGEWGADVAAVLNALPLYRVLYASAEEQPE